MPARGGKVHVAVTRRHYKGKEYTTTLLRRSYRENGKVKNETVGNLSHLDEWMIDGLGAMLAGRRLVDLDREFEIVRSLPHGHVTSARTPGREPRPRASAAPNAPPLAPHPQQRHAPTRPR
jgi:hypothetical protein